MNYRVVTTNNENYLGIEVVENTPSSFTNNTLYLVNDSDFDVVDLGLSVKWRLYNLGTSDSTEVGKFYAWGEKSGYTLYQVTTSKVRSFNTSSYQASSISSNLTLENDVANIELGGKYRIPTRAEYQELYNNCNWAWDYSNNGYTITSRINGNSIFLPSGGRCSNNANSYTSYGFYIESNYENATYCALTFFNSSTINVANTGYYRYWGYNIRPIKEF